MFIKTLHYNITNNNIIAGIATTSMETVLDPTKHWLDQLEKTFGGNLIQDVIDCYLERSFEFPGQVRLDICPKLSVDFRLGLLAHAVPSILWQ